MWNLLAPFLANVGGAYIAGNANQDAANTASAATIEGAQIQANAIAAAEAQEQQYAQTAQQASDAAAAQSKAEVDAANAKATQEYQAAQTAAAPGQSYLRNVVANPGSLTPLQQQQLAELQRTTGNQISTSAIAGSGRTAASLLRNTELSFTNNAIATNQARADSAAGTLAGQYGAAGNSIASTDANTGSQEAGITENAGNQSVGIDTGLGTNTANLTAAGGAAAGNATAAAGVIQGQATAATGAVQGQAIGSVGSIIANQQRQSRYDDLTASVSKLSKNSGSSSGSSDTFGNSDGS